MDKRLLLRRLRAACMAAIVLLAAFDFAQLASLDLPQRSVRPVVTLSTPIHPVCAFSKERANETFGSMGAVISRDAILLLEQLVSTGFAWHEYLFAAEDRAARRKNGSRAPPDSLFS